MESKPICPKCHYVMVGATGDGWFICRYCGSVISNYGTHVTTEEQKDGETESSDRSANQETFWEKGLAQ